MKLNNPETTPRMNRRKFLERAGGLGVGIGIDLGAGVLSLARPANARARGEQAMTVLGPIAPQRLGRTLMHEHVMVDFIGADLIAPGRYDPEEVFRKALPHLQRVKSAGCDTLVDCTPAYVGRDPELLRRLSQASSLQMVTNTGFYGAARDKFVPGFAYTETAGQLAARWAKEFEDGILPSGVRPGFIKIGVDAGPLSEIDAKLVAAAAMTHQRTSLTIASHTGDGVAAMAQIAALTSHGVPPSGFIWVHAQNEPDTSFHLRAADSGAWVEFDGISRATVQKHVELVLGMKRAGHLDRVLLSQDSGWYHVGEPSGGDFHPYDLLFTEFLPSLHRAGISEKDIETLMVRNPRAVLTLPSFVRAIPDPIR